MDRADRHTKKKLTGLSRQSLCSPLQSDYKDEPDVSELGAMIRETVSRRMKQKQEQIEIEKDY
jgi:hypothetical protein